MKRKADREAAAKLLVELATSLGAEASYEAAPLGDRCLWVHIHAAPAHVTISIDGEASPGFLTPWNIDFNSDTQFSPAFGSAVRAEVNPYHKRKCMGYAATLTALVTDLERALTCINDKEAFL
jgi:hypothetical protein